MLRQARFLRSNALGKKNLLVYGGGSALALHKIPYKAPKGALYGGNITDLSLRVNHKFILIFQSVLSKLC